MGTPPPPEARTLRRISRQTMVALPSWVRRRLAVAPGSVVYWHGHRRGEVILAAHEVRVRGPAGRRDLEDELRQVVAERDSFKQALAGHDLADQRQLYAGGVMQGMKLAGPLLDQLDAIRRDVAALGARLDRLPGARRTRPLRAVVSRRRPVEPVLLPGEKPPFAPYPAPSEPGESAEVTGPA